jgi:hypothetical protein
MLPVCISYLRELEGLYNGIRTAIADLPVEALNWSPAPGMNSIAVLVTHATGSQRFLVGDLVGGIASNRDRNAEFAVTGLDSAALGDMLTHAMTVTRSALDKLTLEELNSAEPRVKDGRSFPVALALDHALAHSGVHAGHIEMTRQMWDQKR